MSGPSEKAEKSEKADKKAKPAGIALPTGTTDLRARVPSMADDVLATLRANAERMLASGNAAQKASANDLIPVIEQELAERKAKKAATAPRKGGRKAKAPTDGDAQS